MYAAIQVKKINETIAVRSDTNLLQPTWEHLK